MTLQDVITLAGLFYPEDEGSVSSEASVILCEVTVHHRPKRVTVTVTALIRSTSVSRRSVRTVLHFWDVTIVTGL
jgi:hypothetical protein